MSDYLKDKNISYLTVQGSDLDALNSDVCTILKDALSSDETLHIEYIIRYDGIGVIRKDYAEIKKCFDISRNVERIAIRLKHKESYFLKGKDIEIRLDSSNFNNCYLKVADDNEAWVEKHFKALSSRLDKFRNKNSFVYSPLSDLAIQLFGILSGLFLCLISAKLLAPLVQIQHSFIILFIGIFLVFSNLWTYILRNINRIRFKYWPFVSFNRKPLGIIGQSIIGLIITSFVIFLAKLSLGVLINASQIL